MLSVCSEWSLLGLSESLGYLIEFEIPRFGRVLETVSLEGMSVGTASVAASHVSLLLYNQ